MKNTLTKTLILAMLILFSLVANIAKANDAAHEKILGSLVHIVAKGKGQRAPYKSAWVEKSSTGFIVSADGFILTSYHLLADIQRSAATDLKIRVAIGKKQPQDPSDYRVAQVVSRARLLDLLLLKIAPKEDEILRPVRFGKSSEIKTETKLFFSGFPGTGFSRKPAELNNRLGLFWTFNQTIVEGQSGSPLYNEDAEVIGLLKGSFLNDSTETAVVPIELADTVLVHIKLAQLSKDMERIKTLLGDIAPEEETPPFHPRLRKIESGMENVGKYIDWDCQLEPGHNILIKYRRPTKGKIDIEEITYKISTYDSVNTSSNGTPKLEPRKSDLIAKQNTTRLKNTEIDEAIRGAFRIRGVGDKLNDKLEGNRRIANITRIYVEFAPILKNGITLDQHNCILFVEKPLIFGEF